MKTFVALACLSLIYSCSKSNSPDSAVNNCNKIVEVLQNLPYESPPYQTVATLTYDSKGRIKTSVGIWSNKTEYTYYDDSIVIKATDINGVNIGSVLYLDKQSRVIRSKAANPEFTYDADGHLVSYKQPYGDNGQIYGYIKYFLVWENGNLITLYTNEPNVSNQRVDFKYYDLPNQNLLGYNSPFYLGGITSDRNSFFLLDGPYFGKQSKNLLRSINSSSDIVYQSDSTGRIIMDGFAYKFKYQCP